ncbi:PPC domain-containing DNA-binding protein [Chloroflexota bacterium]
MSVFEYNSGSRIMVRVRHDADLMGELNDLAVSQGIEAATFTAIGALKCATLGYYNQTGHQYGEIDIDYHCEIASCIGNISIKDGTPFVHAHAVLADDKGNTKAGHLLGGTVFAAEVHIRTLVGPTLERQYDEVTGLSLWQTED